jgi:MFS family permease
MDLPLTMSRVLIQSVGLGESMARLLAACNSVSYLLFSLIGIPNVERWGRRKLMMICAAGQCFCYLLITVLIRYNEKAGYAHQKEVAAASVAFFFLYYVFFGIGWQGVPWLYPVEINSLGMRTKGAGLGTASNWVSGTALEIPCDFLCGAPVRFFFAELLHAEIGS